MSDGTVDEKGLVDGSGEVADPAPNSDTSETTTGTFTIATGNDTLGTLEVRNSLGVFVDVTAGGTVQGTNGVLTVTNTAGVYTWSYTLSDNLLSHTDTDSVTDGDSDRGVADQVAGEAFAVRVTDNEGDVSTETTLDITVNDDGPTANDDLATQPAENQAITIDVFANDVAGADGVNLTTGSRSRPARARERWSTTTTAASPTRRMPTRRARTASTTRSPTGRRHLDRDGDGHGCGGFCAEPGVDDQPDG